MLTESSGHERRHQLAGDSTLDETAGAAVMVARHVEVVAHVVLHAAADTMTSGTAIATTTATVIDVIAATLGLARPTTVTATRKIVSAKTSAHAVMLRLVMLIVAVSQKMMRRVNARTASLAKVCWECNILVLYLIY
jgi:hypothetical protein